MLRGLVSDSAFGMLLVANYGKNLLNDTRHLEHMMISGD